MIAIIGLTKVEKKLQLNKSLFIESHTSYSFALSVNRDN